MVKKCSQGLAAGILALGLAAAPAVSSAQEFINILTGGTSGVYYPLGVALSKVYSAAMPDAKVQVQSTKASVENVNLLQKGRGEIGFALADTVRSAYEGEAEAGFDNKLDKLRAIAATYSNYVQIVASKESGITDLAGLKGKAISVGAPKSGTELNARRIFAAAGMSYDDLSKTEYLPFGESVELIKNRQLDGTLQSAGLGVASIRDLATSLPTTVVAVPAEIADKLGAPFSAGVIPAGTYEGQEADVPTLAIPNILVTHAEVSDDVAYMMTKALFENLPELVAAHQAAKAISPENGPKNLPLPLHPGAERYYKEAGLL
ncbi:MAG: TAXI family TRAP transporter solute-binding subunit [Gammaproteobacteria bacterium]|nr:TAXI family TRAP transporter solute-binding subunit [Gammaproteobacteria bacterium]